jgi:hypothetical protein
MDSTQIFKQKIADKLKEIYEQHEYEIKQENYQHTVIQLMSILKEDQVDIFFKALESGKLGILYKMPTCILSMAQKYSYEHPVKPRLAI